uniref:Uncharacterized protein n=1 Tax=Timema genevievae TaxID=629358 RepID=A0A7R9JML1_TIMGE|nr:unnamed protein product [Timema genevievae]
MRGRYGIQGLVPLSEIETRPDPVEHATHKIIILLFGHQILRELMSATNMPEPSWLGRYSKTNVCRCTVTLIGLYSFVLSKRSVDRHRYEDMKVRERMRNSNEGECEVTLNSNHG